MLLVVALPTLIMHVLAKIAYVYLVLMVPHPREFAAPQTKVEESGLRTEVCKNTNHKW